MNLEILIETEEQRRTVSAYDLITNPDIRKARLPWEKADFLVCPGECPVCRGTYLPDCFAFKGNKNNVTKVNDRLFYTVAHCVHCDGIVGTLKVEDGSIFGADEDAAVLASGRWRVY